MAQLNVVVVLWKDPSLMSSSHAGQYTNAYNSSFWRSNTLFWPLQTSKHLLHTHTETHIYTLRKTEKKS